MKHSAWVILSLSFLLIGCESELRGDKISLIAELPNTTEYAINGVFVDIGIVYDTIGIPMEAGAECIIYNYNKNWCLFNDGRYWVIDKTRLDEIAEKAGIILPSDMVLPFWDEWGGRIFIIAIIFIVALGIYIWSKIQPKLKILKPFHPNLNKQNAANLIFDGHYKVKKYNGSSVKWSTVFAKSVSILLPPGKCSLIFDFKESDGQTKFTAHDHEANSIIETGKTYYLKSFLNNMAGNNIMSTYIMEGKEEYGRSSGVWRASWRITRVGKNITPDTVPQFINDFLKQKKNKEYHFVDERGDNAVKLYNEFSKYPIAILSGDVYAYKSGYWLLLISHNELGIMLSFTSSKN